MAKVKAQTNITHSQMVAEKNPDKQKKKTIKTKTKQNKQTKNKYVLNDKNYIRIRVRVLQINLE